MSVEDDIRAVVAGMPRVGEDPVVAMDERCEAALAAQVLPVETLRVGSPLGGLRVVVVPREQLHALSPGADLVMVSAPLARALGWDRSPGPVAFGDTIPLAESEPELAAALTQPPQPPSTVEVVAVDPKSRTVTVRGVG